MNTENKKTDLLTIREFLRSQGAEPAPWEEGDAVLSRLYDVLSEKRADARFWTELKTLVENLDDHRFNWNPARGSQALYSGDVDELIDALRESIATQNGGGMRPWLDSRLGAAALLSFSLIGASFACYSGDSGDSGSSECQAAKDYGISKANSDVFCALSIIVNGSDVSDAEKSDVMDCLAGMDASAREYLLDKFQNLSQEDLAKYLDHMRTAGDCGVDSDWADDYNDNWYDDDH